MPDADAVRAALQGALGARASALDGEVLDYVSQCLADDDMEWGTGGEGAYDAVGEMLAEAAGGDDAVKKLCAALADALHVGAAKAAPTPPEPPRRTPVVVSAPAMAMATRLRVLTSACCLSAQMGALTADEVGGAKGTLARGVITACSDGAEQDAAKASKRAAREEAKSRSAYEKHLAELAAAATGDHATIVRNAGGGGQRDIALENLVITNGGEPLIEDGTLTLAHGRRYGMIGRNGSGKTTVCAASVASRASSEAAPAAAARHR